MHLFIVGYPSDIGGANTELWHSVKLWRRCGVELTLIPPWKADPIWRQRLDAIGCRTCECNPDDLQNCPGLAGSVVVSMCNTRFLDVVARFRELDCKIVWLGCMNWLFPSERRHYREFGTFDRYVFQSRFQHDELCGQLAKYGYRESQGRVIHGAFDIEDFPFRPLSHEPGQTFVVGHLSRAATEKFSPRLWNVWGQVASPMCARVMGWSRAVQTRVGRPPRWAECLPAGFETSQSFLASVQCLSPMGDTIENWPQVGLEAMASGVPLVVENQGGWMEMIRHGQTGFLCDSDAEMVEAVSRLARDEPLRQDVIENARHVVEKQWANVQTWWDAWSDLLKDTAGNDENCRRLCDV